MADNGSPWTVPVAAKDKEEDATDKMLSLEEPENIPDPKRKAYRLRLKGMLSGSTISGISQAFSDRKGAYKIFWIVLFALGCLGFAINFYQIIVHFVKKPILTQLDRSSSPFQWPHLTFCNPMNPIPFEQSDGLQKKWTELFEKAGTYNLPPYGPANRRHWKHNLAMASLNPVEFYEKGIDSIILYVRVQFKEYGVASSSFSLDQYNTVRNKKAIFKSRMDSFRYPTPCYTLMPEKIKEQMNRTGKFADLLSVKIYAKMDFKSYEIFNASSESRKLYFYITNPSETLQAAFPHDIRVGTDSFFYIKQRYHERVANCIDEHYSLKLFTASMTSSHNYTGLFDDCRNYLSQRLFYYKCKCNNPHLPIYKFMDGQPKICTNMSEYDEKAMRDNIECMNKAMTNKKTLKSFEKQLDRHCKKFDQHQCKSNVYGVTRNSNTRDGKMNEARSLQMERQLKMISKPGENITSDFYLNNFIIITVNKAKDSTEFTFEEFEYPMSQFLSDFGGAVGLWIGLSIISFFEIMELMFVFIKYLRN